MKTPAENKAVTPRMHRIGGWCEDCLVRPSDDQPSIDTDPAVQAAAQALALAEAAFADADAAWIDRVRATRSAELKARSAPAVFTAGWTPVLQPDPAFAQIPGLREGGAAARGRRDKAADTLTAARVAHCEATVRGSQPEPERRRQARQNRGGRSEGPGRTRAGTRHGTGSPRTPTPARGICWPCSSCSGTPNRRRRRGMRALTQAALAATVLAAAPPRERVTPPAAPGALAGQSD